MRESAIQPDEKSGAMHVENDAVENMFTGPIVPLLFRLALPTMAGMLIFLIYNLTDITWISFIDLKDPAYVGGIGIVLPIIFLAIAVNNGLNTGVSSVVARATGRNDQKTISQVIGSGLVISIFLSLLLALAMYLFGKKIVLLLGAKGDYYTHGLDYLYYVLPAGIAIFITAIFNGFLQGRGLMKYIMFSVLLGTIANIVLDPVFIFLLKLHVKGAAIATVIAQVITLTYLIVIIYRKKWQKEFSFSITNINLRVTREITVIGFPQASSMLIMTFVFIVTNNILVNLNAHAFSAFTIAGKLEQILQIPGISMGVALLTMAGQNLGRGNWERIRKIWITTIIACLVVTLVLCAVFFLLTLFIYPFFSKVTEVVKYAVLHSRFEIPIILFSVITILAQSYFQGVGRALPTFLIPVARFALFSIPLVYLLVFLFKTDVYGVLIGYLAGTILSSFMSWVWVTKHITRNSGESGVQHTLTPEETGALP